MSINESTIEAAGLKRIGKSRLFGYGLSWFQGCWQRCGATLFRGMPTVTERRRDHDHSGSN